MSRSTGTTSRTQPQSSASVLKSSENTCAGLPTDGRNQMEQKGKKVWDLCKTLETKSMGSKALDRSMKGTAVGKPTLLHTFREKKENGPDPDQKVTRQLLRARSRKEELCTPKAALEKFRRLEARHHGGSGAPPARGSSALAASKKVSKKYSFKGTVGTKRPIAAHSKSRPRELGDKGPPEVLTEDNTTKKMKVDTIHGKLEPSSLEEAGGSDGAKLSCNSSERHLETLPGMWTPGPADAKKVSLAASMEQLKKPVMQRLKDVEVIATPSQILSKLKRNDARRKGQQHKLNLSMNTADVEDGCGLSLDSTMLPSKRNVSKVSENEASCMRSEDSGTAAHQEVIGRLSAGRRKPVSPGTIREKATKSFSSASITSESSSPAQQKTTRRLSSAGTKPESPTAVQQKTTRRLGSTSTKPASPTAGQNTTRRLSSTSTKPESTATGQQKTTRRLSSASTKNESSTTGQQKTTRRLSSTSTKPVSSTAGQKTTRRLSSTSTKPASPTAAQQKTMGSASMKPENLMPAQQKTVTAKLSSASSRLSSVSSRLSSVSSRLGSTNTQPTAQQKVTRRLNSFGINQETSMHAEQKTGSRLSSGGTEPPRPSTAPSTAQQGAGRRLGTGRQSVMESWQKGAESALSGTNGTESSSRSQRMNFRVQLKPAKTHSFPNRKPASQETKEAMQSQDGKAKFHVLRMDPSEAKADGRRPQSQSVEIADILSNPSCTEQSTDQLGAEGHSKDLSSWCQTRSG